MNLCAPHYSAKKSGGDIEEGVAAFNDQAAQNENRRRSDDADQIDVQKGIIYGRKPFQR